MPNQVISTSLNPIEVIFSRFRTTNSVDAVESFDHQEVLQPWDEFLQPFDEQAWPDLDLPLAAIIGVFVSLNSPN